jgi:BirA family biotin operon repressor/biotin-[acetyl-CoA-carboxylase] ligase
MSQFGEIDGWGVYRHWKINSTNDLARELSAWQAVVAEIQEAGRGRYGRAFQSSEGGLWLSAVLPLPGGPNAWSGLALAIGWALCQWLRALPVAEARLRWPNDILVGPRKLAGLLLEQSSPELCIVGVGLNLTNRPWEDDPGLSGITTRLADEFSPCPNPAEALPSVLRAIRLAHARMAEAGLSGLAEEINACWDFRPAVRLILADGPPQSGRFTGIDGVGALRLNQGGREQIYPAHHVHRLEEIAQNPAPNAPA